MWRSQAWTPLGSPKVYRLRSRPLEELPLLQLPTLRLWLQMGLRLLMKLLLVRLRLVFSPAMAMEQP
jgi:hypothetical protein